ncbi:ubiquitin domain protein [Aspergillus campestris IBT 28561]|uniref:Ubiquitin domain protein n=1 Tax=Aspergillus campestris (strain IBT 28561) TaxID=1392248 RepID=A0A2I1DGM6_ASPC2|nr:ubiquitin domain protein [Aspergillus campestris IBT 28561]PKY09022.1 ubiquitin domain protein [Aspergillus campestris IBT 28561]
MVRMPIPSIVAQRIHGCCFSVSRDDSHSSAGHDEHPSEVLPEAPSSSTTTSTAAAAAARRSNRPNLPPTTPHIVVRTSSDQFPLDVHFNAPVRQHIWYSKRRAWTRTQLDRERREFFETRVTGRSEIWAALSTAIALMWAGDLATAQSIVDAAGVTVPTGDLCQGCYDEQGVLYRLPQCIVSDPQNIVREPLPRRDDDDDDDDFDTDHGKLSLDEASDDELISDELERRRDEKGKTSERDLIHNVAFIARKVQQEAGIARNQRVRIAYLGRVLNEHVPLVDQGWNPAHVVNALVVSRPSLS